MHWLTALFQKIAGVLHGPKAQAVEETLSSLTLAAMPIVAAVSALCPNQTVQQISAAYTKYGVPLASQIRADPTSTGNALLNLSTAVLQKNLPPAQAAPALSLLNTAVQLAVVASKLPAGA